MVANFKDEIIQILNEKTFSRETSSWNPVESWSAGYIKYSGWFYFTAPGAAANFPGWKTLKMIGRHILGHWDNPRELTSDQISEKVWTNVWDPPLLKKSIFQTWHGTKIASVWLQSKIYSWGQSALWVHAHCALHSAQIHFLNMPVLLELRKGVHTA